MDKKLIKKQSEFSADGTENSEHILDLRQQIDMFYSNIKDNTDLAVELYKLKKAGGEGEDLLDAAQVVCESIIKIEKLAAELNSLQNQIGADENKLKDIYDKMKLFEEKSSKKLACIMLSFFYVDG